METRTHTVRFDRLTASLVAMLFVALGTSGADGATTDLSSHFDTASDFAPMNVIHNSAGTVGITAITDVAGGIVEFRLQVTPRTVSGFAFGRIDSTATFDPSTQGAISSIDWSTEIRYNNTGGGEIGQMMPILVQGGNVYVYKGGNMDPSNALAGNTFYNFNTVALPNFLSQEISGGAVAADFLQIATSPYGYAGGAGGGPTTLAGNSPDFTISGGVITFGYLELNADSDARDNRSQMRNTSVVVNHAAVPAPAALPAGLAMMLGLAARRRRPRRA